MKITTCQNCRRRQYDFLYTPKFCIECGGENLVVASYIEWLAALLIFALIILSLTAGF